MIIRRVQFAKQRNDETIILFSSVLFLINPLISILLTAYFAYTYKSEKFIKVLMIFSMLYLCALNTTKVPENDMMRYLESYQRVPRFSLEGFLMRSGLMKEVAYQTLVYILYYVTIGNQYLFIFVVSFLGYWFMFMSIFKFGKEYNLPIYIIVTEVLFLSFFLQYFSLTFHLIRQVLATSVFIYALTFRNTSFWRYLLFCFFAILFHSAVGILVFLSIIPIMKRRLKMKEIGLFIVFAAFCIIILTTFASYALFILESEESNQMTYALSRVAGMEGAHDSTTFGLGRLSISLSIIMIILCMIERNKKKAMYYPVVVNVCLVMSFMILGLSASPLVQLRFFFFVYSFLPLLFPIFLREKINISKAICFVTIVVLIVLFYARLNHVFEYVSEEEALLLPYPSLIKLS